MENHIDILEAALSEIEIARKRVARVRTVQVTQGDARDLLKSTALAWFRSHRPALVGKLPATGMQVVDEQLQRILDASDRASSKTTYVTALKEGKKALTNLRADGLTMEADDERIDEAPPDFSPLAADPVMQTILRRRWAECQKCLMADAHLAATVMMGGLLEALLVARANHLADKSAIFKAKTAPRDFKTKQTLPLKDWTLRHYIDVAEELSWISPAAKHIAAVLRDYRNYVHPEKERSHGIALNTHDVGMFWMLTKSLTKQLLELA